MSDIEQQSVVLDEAVELAEAVGDDGTFAVKVIEAGWGTSGFYGKDILARDAGAAFPVGTHMYWNHPTRRELSERGGLRDMSDLRAVLVESAHWDDAGRKGPGVYARAKVFGPFRDAIREMAPFMGLSIHASGAFIEGEADGRKGRIITRLDEDRNGLHSVDFVPRAGAGGRMLTMLEGAMRGTPGQSSDKEQDDMGEENKQLTEAQSRITALEADIAAKDAKIAEQAQVIGDQATKLTEMQQAGEKAKAEALIEAKVEEAKLPPLTAKRVKATLAASLPITEGALDAEALEANIKTAVEEAQAEIAEHAPKGTGVTGMGASPESDNGRTALKEQFKARYLDQGMTPEEAERRASLAVGE